MKLRFAVWMVALAMISFSPALVSAGTGSEDAGFFNGMRIFPKPGIDPSRSLSGGIGVGDIDGDGTNEIAISDFEGNVVLIKEVDVGSFESDLIYTEPRKNGEVQGLLDLVVGDILLDRPGVEVLAGGYSKDLVVIYKEGDGYVSDIIYTSPYQIFNIDTGDFYTSYPGEEIVLASFDIGTTDADSDRVIRVLHREGASFIVEGIDLPDTPKGIEIANIDPKVAGNELWVTTSGRVPGGGTESGLYEVRPDRTVIERYKNPSTLIANVKAGDIWAGNPGQELLTVDFGGLCKMMWEEEDLYKSTEIFAATNPVGEPALLEGLFIADINPGHPGEEGLVTGYYNDVTEVLEVEGEMTSAMIWQAPMTDIQMEISGIAVGEFSEVYPGVEIAVASRVGWVEMIHYEEDGVGLWADDANIEIEDGIEGEFQLEVIPEGYARGEVEFSVEGGEGLDFTFPRIVLEDHEPVFATVKVISDFGDASNRIVPFTVSATVDGERSAAVEMQATVVMSGDISLSPSSLVIYPEVASERVVKMTLQGLQKVNLTVEAPTGIVVKAPSVLMKDKEATMTVMSTKGPGNYTVKLKGMVGSRLAVETILHVKVRPVSQDLDIALDEVSKDVYRVTVDYEGGRIDYPVTIGVYVGDDLVNSTEANLTGPRKLTFQFTYRQDRDQDVKVTLSTGGSVAYSEIAGRVNRVETEKETIPTVLLVLFLVVMGLLAVLLFLGLTKLRPAPGEDTGIERIGGPSRYHLGPERPRRTGAAGGRRMAPSSRERNEPPPRDRRPRPVPDRQGVGQRTRLVEPPEGRYRRDRPPRG